MEYKGYEKAELGEYVPYSTRGESYELVDDKKMKAIVLALLEEKGKMTSVDITNEAIKRGWLEDNGIDYRQKVAPRLTELTKEGIIEPIGKVESPKTGRKISVYAMRETRC